ncbi:CPBP family intramembrane glutamic endopeptidase [Paucibacter sp. M5-1]|uniref:CPBP family intramembrane glutamic endopeptidase n=1 Tax=Paucibacter sp. M5-1 TaxID=3015998 RepID=UPI0022B90B4C|nr:type II CAAX endopeptidase family protein [Paucibacter sp. M5-1]MCZ7882723.1 type II CAAX endopeptidase family protein [Paucibacter sp. M5-1]
MKNTLAISPPSTPQPSPGPEAKPSLLARYALLRVLLGSLMVIAAMSVVMVLAENLPKSARLLWPQLLAAVLMAAAFRFYALRIDRRPATEFASAGAARELGLGLLGGALLVVMVFGALALLNVFHLQGMHPVGLATLKSFGDMTLVAVFEELLVRGILFKALERVLGSVPALLASSLLFGLAHLPNDGATLLSTLNVTVAGILFAAAYLASGRLWLGIGLHLAWNFCAGHLFSAVVSGHKAEAGLLYGQLAGPNWLTGGAFGIEGSVITLLALLGACALLLALAHRRGRLLPRSSRQAAP